MDLLESGSVTPENSATARLIDSQTEGRRLLEAILHETLAPAALQTQ